MLRSRAPVRYPMNFRFALCCVAIIGRVLAVDSTEKTLPPGEAELRRIEGVFGSDLPTTEPKGSVRLILHPHLGDFTNRNYLRLLTGFRYGLTDRTEVTAGLESYIDHGLKRTSEGTGIGDVRLETKHRLGEDLIAGYETSVGLNLYFPVDHPPEGMTNGHNRYTPYVVIGKRLQRWRGLTVFAQTGANVLKKTHIPGTFERNDLHTSSLFFTPGVIYTRYPFHYTLELTYATTSLIGRDNQQAFTVRPGFAWDLPPAMRFHSKGRVTVAVGYHVTFGPDGTSSGGGGKMRAEFRLSKWMQRDVGPARPR